MHRSWLRHTWSMVIQLRSSKSWQTSSYELKAKQSLVSLTRGTLPSTVFNLLLTAALRIQPLTVSAPTDVSVPAATPDQRRCGCQARGRLTHRATLPGHSIRFGLCHRFTHLCFKSQAARGHHSRSPASFSTPGAPEDNIHEGLTSVTQYLFFSSGVPHQPRSLKPGPQGSAKCLADSWGTWQGQAVLKIKEEPMDNPSSNPPGTSSTAK